MAGFRKAKGEQASLKIGVYGPPGSGKTFTSLLIAEGLAQQSGKRIAFVDTERGTDFYCKPVPSREIHPEAFDFDALYSRSIVEVLQAVRSLKPDDYGVVVIDSVTHIWEACIAAHSGKTTSAGTIPMHAWGKIKKPYKELMSLLLSSPMHAIICGRQGVEYSTDEETEELKAVGVKMKAEGETPYEPHILIRMESLKPKRTNERAQIVAYAEKDRTGILSGRSFINPTYKMLCEPLMGLLGGTQAKVSTSDETAAVDAERLAAEDAERRETSAKHLREYSARLELAKDEAAIKGISKEITPQLKAQMLPADVATLREAYLAAEKRIKTGGAVTADYSDSQVPENELVGAGAAG